MTTTRYVAPGIQRRHRTLYAIQEIPKAVRPYFNGRARFVQSLETDSLQVAKVRAAVLIADWKAQIEAARSDTPVDNAAFFRKALQRSRSTMEAERILADIEIEADNLASVTMTESDTRADYREQQAAARQEASEFYATATGETVLLSEHIEPWLETADMSLRTRDAARREVRNFVKLFPTVDGINKPAIQDYVYDAAKGVARGTLQKRLGYLRGLWRYLQRNKLVPMANEPFLNLDIPKAPKNGNGKRRPFTRDDINKLLANSDGVLRAVIALAAYTGARFSELTALRLEDVTEDAFLVRGGKTDAAEREIPIHSAIKGLVDTLKAQSKDGWLLEGDGLATNNLGERGRSLGKYFGRFKRELGFDERYVFHSIRKTVATQFEEAQVPEFIAARILGHALKTMSYGLYSGGVALETKREAIERAIHY